jgi:hypothetical protein
MAGLFVATSKRGPLVKQRGFISLGDFVLVFWQIIRISVREMTILAAYAGQFTATSINNLESMLRFPIALGCNLNINSEIMTTYRNENL